jgi:hypothetical protein
MTTATDGQGLRTLTRNILVPIAIYFVLFAAFTFPLLRSFSTHFFADKGDGLQNVWNLWWVDKAIVQLGQHPWHTGYLHYPYGISLLGHTLNPVNGLMSLPLLRLLSLTQAHNIVIVFSFVVGGLTAFLLARYLTHAYWPSIIAGFIFSFSNFHFAHAEGHMQLVALEWIPLFLLFWMMLLVRPSLGIGLAAALALFLVILSDYYYFLYSVLAAIFMVAWYAIRQRDVLFLVRPRYRRAMAVFLIVSMATSGILVLALLRLQTDDPLLAIYVPERFSLDLLAPFVPGGHWRFAELTQGYWSQLPGGIHESSVYLGWSVILLLVYVFIRRRKVAMPSLGYWYFLLLFFAIMSLGPVLHVLGQQVSDVRLPYDLIFQRLFPPLRVARVPVRMMVMVSLSAAVISGAGFKLLFRQSTGTRILASVLVGVLLVEYLPKPIPETRIPPPDYITQLRDLPGMEGVADIVHRGPVTLYYQTIHEKPIAFGYVSRVPTSTEAKDLALREIIDSGRYAELCRRYGVRYLVADWQRDVLGTDPAIQAIYGDDQVRVYDLGATAPCRIAAEVIAP